MSNNHEGSRIRIFRESLNLNQSAFADILGVKQPFVSGVEKGTTLLSYEHVKLLFTKYNMNIHWYASGKGLMNINKNDIVEVSSLMINEPSTNYRQSKQSPANDENLKEIKVLQEKLKAKEEEVNKLQSKLNTAHEKLIDLLESKQEQKQMKTYV
jgi:transcriptional regulator with XRE-family HTH domain